MSDATTGEEFTPGQWKAAYQQAETPAQRVSLLIGYLMGTVPPVEEVQAALELLEEGQTEQAGDHQAVMEGEPAAAAAVVAGIVIEERSSGERPAVVWGVAGLGGFGGGR